MPQKIIYTKSKQKPGYLTQ